MPTKITRTVRDGLLVTSAVSTSGIYRASQYNLLQALASLRQVLPQEDYDKFSNDPVPDSSLNGVVELSRGIGKRSKGRFQQLSNRFESFLQSILRFSAVIDVLVSSGPRVAALIWGSVKFVITVALDYLDYFKQISQVFQELGNLCPFLDRFAQLFPESDELRDSLADFYAVSIGICTEALTFLRGSTLGQIMKAIWKPFNINFQDLQFELQRQRGIVDREIQLASEVAAHRERQQASLYRSAGTQHHQEMTLYQEEHRQNHSTQMIRLADIENLSIQQHTDSKKRRRAVLLAAVSGYNHRPSFSNACDKRHNNTGLWLFDVLEFMEWIQNQKSCGLWCYGIPGAGKTILTAGAIDYLFLHHQGRQVSISYFFCEFGIEESTQIRTILRSLIKQILSVFVQLSPDMEKKLEAVFLGNYGHREPDMEQLYEVLLSVTQLAATTYLIIDGVDECKCDDRYRLLSYMNQLIRDSKSRVKVIISSRQKIDISRSLKHFCHISLDSARNHSDIEKYIRAVVDDKLRQEVLKVSRPSMAEEIKDALIRGADGMFLWVEFQIFEICRENNDHDIRKVLRSLPKGLDGTYSRILERIARNHKPEVAKKVFTWLAVGRRPLSLAELNEAVAFDLGCLRWDQGTFQNDAFNMLRNCGNLVNHKNDGTVRFAHYTVLEFLTSGRATARFSDRTTVEFSVRHREADLYVGKICLMYLNFPDFEAQLSRPTKCPSIPATSEWLRSMGQHNPLIEPLSRIHRGRQIFNATVPVSMAGIDTQTLRGATNTGARPPDVLCQKFCLLDYVAKNWIYHCSELPQNNKEDWNLFTNLVFDRTLLLDHIPWRRLDSYGNPNEFYHEVLLWAVGEGNPALLKAVINESGTRGTQILAYINMRNAVGQTPIQLASSRGNEFVLKHLIDNGANVNATLPGLSFGRTALQAAAEAGYLYFVNQLIEAKADVNAGPGYDSGRTALQAAAGGGHLDVVNRLIEAKADVNAGPGSDSGRTALQAAAGGGYLDVVNRLIEAKADINAGPAKHSGRTALQAAAGGGHLDVVNRLIEAKADVNAGPGYDSGRTALQAAAGGGHLDVVNRLIEAKADVNAGPGYDSGRTALQAAAGGGHLDVVNRLIEAKADINAGPAKYCGRTALQAASGGGHLDVVNRLIEAKADINAGPAKYCGRTALQAAAGGGHLDVVNRLIEAKANINAGPGYDSGRTALQAAAGGGHLDVVNRLVEAKADINAGPAKCCGRTALQAAAGGGHLDVVNRLIEVKADVNAGPAERFGRTALQAAEANHHSAILERLGGAGAKR